MTRYAAIPTTYKGIKFRSRLEARWAAYFDQRGWDWVYEPFDLRGYMPDFSVDTVLVEVKPATSLAQLMAPAARIIRVGWRGPFLVVGADPDMCLEGDRGKPTTRRYLGTEAPEAWATACNVTQWLPAATPKICPKCSKPDHFLHSKVCKPKV